MNTEIQKQIEQKYVKKLPEFNVGDTVSMTTIIREGDKQRSQIFRGIILSVNGAGLGKTFTIRKITEGVGVEKVMPFNSPNISKFTVIKRGDVRRSKIYYMRKRIGKKALKISEKSGMYDEEIAVENQAEELVAEVAHEVAPSETKE